MPTINFDEGAQTLRLGSGQVFTTGSSTRPGTTHVTVLLENGELWCQCEGFKFRGTCKHTERVLGG